MLIAENNNDMVAVVGKDTRFPSESARVRIVETFHGGGIFPQKISHS